MKTTKLKLLDRNGQSLYEYLFIFIVITAAVLATAFYGENIKTKVFNPVVQQVNSQLECTNCK